MLPAALLIPRGPVAPEESFDPATDGLHHALQQVHRAGGAVGFPMMTAHVDRLPSTPIHVPDYHQFAPAGGGVLSHPRHNPSYRPEKRAIGAFLPDG